jgi:preprotein translocase subunit SecD
MASVGSDAYRLTMNNTESLAMRRDTVTRSMRTIEQRINGLGLAEATVQQRGNGETNPEILVQMPGVDDPARVKAILQAAAMLEIVEVKDGPFPSEEALRAKNGGILPLGTRPIRQATRPGDQGESWYLVNRTAVVTGRDLRNARSSQDQFGKWETSFVLSPDAGRRFGRYTESNVGNKLAVLLDGRARSVAVINSKIEDSGVITGAGSQQEAADLALVLTSGSLPAGVVYLEERTVGPSLGADSIRDGLLAGAVGVGAVVLVMLVYYKRAGINAVLALVLNAIILVAVLAYLGAVLTLPGIAGIILTIGMAVDSNVLIFERIREELRHGKGVLAAIDAGFGKAWLTIVDTHVTTVVSCAFLFIFGTTAVKGFAITLVIGLIANVFTAVFVSRTIFDWELNGKPQSTTLSI